MSDVIILTGLADTRWTWRPVVSALADRHRVQVGDRLVHRRFPSLDREICRIGDLAERSRSRFPVVVAHSFAAFAAEGYARRARLAGLILVDPSCEMDLVPRGAAGQALARTGFAVAGDLGRVLDRTGLIGRCGPALWRWQLHRLTKRVPGAGVTAAARIAYGSGDAVVAAVGEELAYREFAADLARLRRVTPPPECAVQVLTAVPHDPPTPADRRWLRRHRALARSFPAGRHDTVPGSGHLVHLDRPEAIVEAIDRVAGLEGPQL